MIKRLSFVARRKSLICYLFYIVAIFLFLTYLSRPKLKIKNSSKTFNVQSGHVLSNNQILFVDAISGSLSDVAQDFILEPNTEQSCEEDNHGAKLPGHFVSEETNKKDYLLLVLVHSQACHFENRKVIRQTWGTPNIRRAKVLFLLGKPPKNQTCQATIFEEEEKFQDILQGNFIETYRNITLKALTGLKWASKECFKAKFLFKVDDDMYVDMPRIIRSIIKNQISRQNVLMCKPILKSPVLRGGKYAVSRSLYPLETWPTFCFGGAWIASIDVIKKLVQASKFVPQIHLDDVYITGILRIKIKQQIHRMVVDGRLFCHTRQQPSLIKLWWEERKTSKSGKREKWDDCYH